MSWGASVFIMFSRSTVLLFPALVLFANAAPLRHGRRGTCRSHSTISVSAIPSATATAKPTADDSVTVPASSGDDVTSTIKSTKTSSAIVSPPTTTKALATKGKLSSLFPVPGFSKSWSTSPLASNPLPLSDSTFRPSKEIKALSHSYVAAPDGKKAMQAHFPEGSYTYTHSPQGGISFYAPGPGSVDLTTAKEATFGYSVFFEKGFAFNKGGKLPGLCPYHSHLCLFQIGSHFYADGGDSEEEAVSCSGGRRSSKCFSARLMWRGEAAGEFYTYLPPYTDARFAANKVQCDAVANSDCNPTYGASIGRGAFKFADGAWTTVTERVRLNDVGKANGELELFVNGKSIINLDGLILRDSSAGRIRGIQMQTFFGGKVFNVSQESGTIFMIIALQDIPRTLLHRKHRTPTSPTSLLPSQRLSNDDWNFINPH
ncbi:hypothetical protein C0993_004852 [Termitomyces sp. T159_Od127]|nr:hypothetical protein C0993_004852 [Termitomyces sp. T159_Od127]